MRQDPLIPMLAVVTDIRQDTPDVKTFRVVGLDGKKPLVHIPGQCAMLSVPGVGEARRSALLKHFRSVKAIKEASLQELEQAVPKSTAKAVFEWFHQEET